MKKMISLILVVIMAFSVSLAFAKTVTPSNAAGGSLAGLVVNATVGAYNADTNSFTVTLYEDDSFAIEEVEKLAAGDTLLAGGRVYKVKEKTEDEYGDIKVVAENGEEIVFVQVGDDHMMAQSIDDDRRFMHAFAILHLPVAEGVIYEDNSNPEQDAKQVVTEGLDNILKIKAEKEENSNGFDFYATIIELNEDMEIVRIHQDFDVAQ
jgi:hypothetical protein